VLTAVCTLAAVTSLAFVLCTAARGDPALLALQQDGVDPTPELVAQYRLRLGLDEPLPLRYFRWLGSAVRGDLGHSFISNRPVSRVLGERVLPTLLLGSAALLLSTVFGVLLGIVIASPRHASGWFGLRAVLAFLASIPGFWLGIGLIMVFGERLRILPVAGFGTWQHLILPAVALALGPTAALARLTRGVILDELSHDYVRTGRAKGLSETALGLGHLLPNVAHPILALTGVRFGHLLGGSVMIESVFAWPGMGTTLTSAISGRDLPVIGGYVLVTGALVIGARMLVELLAALIDPRTVATP
jgi:peptide/nickel transport system permease protein